MTSRAAAVRGADVLRALESVLDPELGMSVVKLGLIYETAIAGRDVRVVMTLTAPGCPLHGVTDGLREAIAKLPGVERVEVALTFDPPYLTAFATDPPRRSVAAGELPTRLPVRVDGV